MQIYNAAALVGNTPYIRYVHEELPEVNIYIKLEGYNPTGSVKDRACLHMINTMIQDGKLQKGMTLLDASSGNFACSLAYFGKILGFPVEVVVSSKVTKEKQDLIRYFGAGITQVGNFTIDGNNYCRELAPTGNYCFLDQLHNWNNPAAHTAFTAPELLRSFPGLTAVVGSLGSGGTMLGVAEFFRKNRPDVKIITATAAVGTVIPGMAGLDDGDYITPFIKKGWDEQLFDYTIKVEKDGALWGTRELKDAGVFCGPQTGGVLYAALAAAREQNLKGDIVVISGDAGWKNLNKLLTYD